MRIDIMRDIIKYSSLASCDSHTLPSEFQRRAPGFGELRRLSNITEHPVQYFRMGFSPLNGQRRLTGQSKFQAPVRLLSGLAFNFNRNARRFKENREPGVGWPKPTCPLQLLIRPPATRAPNILLTLE